MRTLVRCGAAALLSTLLVTSGVARADTPPAPPPPAPPTAVAPAPDAAPSTGLIAPSTPITLPFPPGGHRALSSSARNGRVVIASDGRGGTGRDANVIAHGDPDRRGCNYGELELRREDRFTPRISHQGRLDALGFFPPFFHFSGDETQAIVIRNLYAQATYDDLTLWVGSRMYRGDDIYLLDWWPLDNQNTVGGGAGYKIREGSDETNIAVHVGMQEARLDLPVRADPRADPEHPRVAGRAGRRERHRPRSAPHHQRPSRSRTSSSTRTPSRRTASSWFSTARPTSFLRRHVYTDTTVNPPVGTALPADTGWLVGTEVAYWTGHRDSFVQLFFRHAEGIAAYDPLAVPLTFANDRTTRGSSETLLALGGNYRVRSLRGPGRRIPPARSATTAIRRRPPRRSTTRASSRCVPSSTSASGGASRSRGPSRPPAPRSGRSEHRAAPRRQQVARQHVLYLLAERTRLSTWRPQLKAHLRRHRAERRYAGALSRCRTIFGQRPVEQFLGMGVQVVVQLVLVPLRKPCDFNAPRMPSRSPSPASPPSRRKPAPAFRSPRRPAARARDARAGLARRGHLPGHRRPVLRRGRQQRLRHRAGIAEPVPGERLARHPEQPRPSPPGARHHRRCGSPPSSRTSTQTRTSTPTTATGGRTSRRSTRTSATSRPCARWWPRRTRPRDEGGARHRLQPHGARSSSTTSTCADGRPDDYVNGSGGPGDPHRAGQRVRSSLAAGRRPLVQPRGLRRSRAHPLLRATPASTGYPPRPGILGTAERVSRVPVTSGALHRAPTRHTTDSTTSRSAPSATSPAASRISPPSSRRCARHAGRRVRHVGREGRLRRVSHRHHQARRERLLARLRRQHARPPSPARTRPTFSCSAKPSTATTGYVGSYTMPGMLDSVFYFPQHFNVFSNVFENAYDPTLAQGTGGSRRSGSRETTDYGTQPQPGGIGIAPYKALVNFIDNHTNGVPRFLFASSGDVSMLLERAHAPLHGGRDPEPLLRHRAGVQRRQRSRQPRGPVDLGHVHHRRHVRAHRQPLAPPQGVRRASPRGHQGRVVEPARRPGGRRRDLRLRTRRRRLAGSGPYALVVLNTNDFKTSSTSNGSTLMQVTAPAGTTLVDAMLDPAQAMYAVDASGHLPGQRAPAQKALILVPQSQVGRDRSLERKPRRASGDAEELVHRRFVGRRERVLISELRRSAHPLEGVHVSDPRASSPSRAHS